MRWAAFDFETATHARDSACAVGVVLVDDGELTYRQAWLIQPPDNRYSPRNVAIHGITPGQTERAPGFADVWCEVEYMVGDRPLIAHNAAFDLSVLEACAGAARIEPRPRDAWCTLRLARKMWPQLGRWNLPTLAHHVGTELHHHDALSDAAACAQIALRCIEETGAAGIATLGRLLDVQPRAIGGAAVPA